MLELYRLLLNSTKWLDAEWTHELALKILEMIPAGCFKAPLPQPFQVMGLTFQHPVCLAAGFDKDGRYLSALAKLGFAGIEVGTVTPKPQSGNIKPRLLRAAQWQALINRMGFNNEGVDALVRRLKTTAYQGVLGISIGPNQSTPPECRHLDYIYCMQKIYAYADYIAINISSPNTTGLRQLQQQSVLMTFVKHLLETRKKLSDEYGRHVPLVVKVSPDESDEGIRLIAAGLVSAGVEGMILTNTSISRAAFSGTRFEHETGGMSGKPLSQRATTCLKLAKSEVGNNLVLIASGGIVSVSEALARIEAGASLVQLYTGLVYQGPRFIRDIVKAHAALKGLHLPHHV